MFKGTKEKKARKLEEKIRVTNLKIYQEKMDDTCFLAGTISTGAIIATLLGTTILNNALTYDLINPIASVPACALIGLACFGTATKITKKKTDNMKRLKFFVENKDLIKAGAEEEISILEARKMNLGKLEKYASDGKSKVLRKTK